MKDNTILFITITLTSDLLLFVMIPKTECPPKGKSRNNALSVSHSGNALMSFLPPL